MYISSYTFTGDPADLGARYDQLLDTFRDELIVHVVVATDTGLVVWDACPDRAAAEAFWTSAAFVEGLARVGLPTPRVEGLGTARFAVANAGVVA